MCVIRYKGIQTICINIYMLIHFNPMLLLISHFFSKFETLNPFKRKEKKQLQYKLRNKILSVLFYMVQFTFMFKLKLWHPFATVIYSYTHPLQNPFFRVTVLNEGVQRLQVLTNSALLFLKLEGKLRNNVEFWINFTQTRRCQPE